MICWPSGVIVSLSQSKNTMNTFGRRRRRRRWSLPSEPAAAAAARISPPSTQLLGSCQL
jgi:hypothetical protein